MTDLMTLKQHRLLSRLLGLSREQGQALLDQRLDDFLTLMDRREEIVAELIEIEQSPPPANILPFPTIIPTTLDQDVRAALRGLIHSILGQDDENERVLRGQMGVLREEVTDNHRYRAAGRGYAATLVTSGARGAVDRAC